MTRPTIDELEILTPEQLWELLLHEVFKKYPDIQLIQDLITSGCPINIMDETGWTALHHASRWAHLEILEFMISNGGDIHIKDFDGLTALDVGPIGIKKVILELEPK